VGWTGSGLKIWYRGTSKIKLGRTRSLRPDHRKWVFKGETINLIFWGWLYRLPNCHSSMSQVHEQRPLELVQIDWASDVTNEVGTVLRRKSAPGMPRHCASFYGHEKKRCRLQAGGLAWHRASGHCHCHTPIFMTFSSFNKLLHNHIYDSK